MPLLAFLALWLLYMSIVNVGQTFYGFGWEMLLLEAGFIVAFLGSDQTRRRRTVLILLVWLVFRLEFGAGMIKIRGGREWRDLTALYYHHETQPMPGPLSRQAHLLPKAWSPAGGRWATTSPSWWCRSSSSPRSRWPAPPPGSSSSPSCGWW